MDTYTRAALSHRNRGRKGGCCQALGAGARLWLEEPVRALIAALPGWSKPRSEGKGLTVLLQCWGTGGCGEQEKLVQLVFFSDHLITEYPELEGTHKDH